MTSLTKKHDQSESAKYHKSPQARALKLLAEVNGKFTNFIQEGLQPYDLTPQQFNLLRILRGAKEEKVNSKILRERLIDKNADVSRLIGRLVEKNLIALENCKADRRQRWVVLTELGYEKLTIIDKDLPGFPFNFLNEIKTTEVDQLIKLLEKI